MSKQAYAETMETVQDGASWSTVFSTDVNSLFVTKAYLGYTAGSKAKLVPSVERSCAPQTAEEAVKLAVKFCRLLLNLLFVHESGRS